MIAQWSQDDRSVDAGWSFRIIAHWHRLSLSYLTVHWRGLFLLYPIKCSGMLESYVSELYNVPERQELSELVLNDKWAPERRPNWRKTTKNSAPSLKWWQCCLCITKHKPRTELLSYMKAVHIALRIYFIIYSVVLFIHVFINLFISCCYFLIFSFMHLCNIFIHLFIYLFILLFMYLIMCLFIYFTFIYRYKHTTQTI